MVDDTIETERPQKRHLFRKIFWLFAAVIGTLVLMNLFFPDIDLSSEDRIALIRVEGVIVDSQATVGELKRFSENPSVKAIVLRIDTPGGGVVP
jgi:protease-4